MSEVMTAPAKQLILDVEVSQRFNLLLESAYTGDLQKAVTRTQFNAAIDEIPTAWVHYDTIGELIESVNNGQALRMARMAILLHARANADHEKRTRKYSDEAIWRHSFRVTAEALKVAKDLITDLDELTEGVVTGKGHDLEEDFKTFRKEIALLFGIKTGESVGRLTVPSTPELAEIYPAITRSFITDARKGKLKAKHYLANLKNRHPASYFELKSRLKRRFKKDGIAHLTLFEVILRAEDNTDSIRAYKRDVAEGRLYISKSNVLGPPRPQARAPRPYSMGEARRNIEDRTAYHGDLLIRIDMLALEAAQAGKSQSELAAFQSIRERIDANFSEQCIEFEELIANAPYARTLVLDIHSSAMVLASRVNYYAGQVAALLPVNRRKLHSKKADAA